MNKLHRAIRNGDIEEVKILLEKGYNPNKMDRKCLMPPLHWAATYGYLEICKILVENGADIDGRDWYDESLADEISYDGSSLPWPRINELRKEMDKWFNEVRNGA